MKFDVLVPSWIHRKAVSPAKEEQPAQDDTQRELEVEANLQEYIHPALLAAPEGFFAPSEPTAKAEENTTMATAPVTPAAPAATKTELQKFESALVVIGKDFEKGLKFAITYAVPVASLVGLLFPKAAPTATKLSDATSLIQNAVLEVEQKYAAAGNQNGSGASKLADVLTITSPVVISLLKDEGINADSNYISSLVNAVVAILNAQQVTTAS